MPVTHTNSRSVHFYWYGGGTNLKVECSAEIVTNGATFKFKGNTHFNVLRPDAEFVGQLDGLVAVDTNFNQSLNALHYGFFQSDSKLTDTNRGMLFHLNSIQTNGFPVGGKFFRHQIVDVYSRLNYFDTNHGAIFKGYGLDTIFPAYTFSLTNLPDFDGDSPGLFTSGTWKVMREDHFKCYLYYQPDLGFPGDTVPVPIKSIEWKWGGLAERELSGWVLLSSPTNATILENNAPCFEYPSWTNNAKLQLAILISTNWF